MQVLPTIMLTNGTQATMDMLVGIMPIHQMDTKHACSLGMDSSASCSKAVISLENIQQICIRTHRNSFLKIVSSVSFSLFWCFFVSHLHRYANIQIKFV